MVEVVVHHLQEQQEVQVVAQLFQQELNQEQQVIHLLKLLLKETQVEDQETHQMDMQAVVEEFVVLDLMALIVIQEQLDQVEQEKILHLYFQDLLSQELEVVEVEDIIIHLFLQEKVD